MKKSFLFIISIGLILFTTDVKAAKISGRTKTVKSNRSVIVSLKSKISKSKSKAYVLADLTKNLEYDFARIKIRDGYYDKLDQLAALSVEKNYAIALRGFADSIGTFKGNWVISQKRADAVKDYLVKKGVPEKKIVSTAFGSTKPVATNKTRAGRQKNRRVEIKVDGITE